MPEVNTTNQHVNAPLTGSFEINGQRAFYKYLPAGAYQRELDGYEALKQYYPVPKLLMHRQFNDNFGILIFEYETSIDTNRGLLVDAVCSNEDIEPVYQKMLSMITPVFKETLCRASGKSAGVFFADRIATRLTDFFPPEFLASVHNKIVRLNGCDYILKTQDTLAQIRNFFENKQDTWCVLAQCDFHDMNLGIKPVMLDMYAGGYNPLMAEFATQFWFTLAMGSYLAPKYHASAYQEHNEIFSHLDIVQYRDGDLLHNPNTKRRKMLEMYITEVIEPTFQTVGTYEDWYSEFKNYLAMKMLAVFDVSKMEPIDQDLTLAYLEKFYQAQPTQPRDLIDMI